MSNLTIVGFDDSDTTERVIDHIVKRGGACGKDLHLVYVLEWSPYSFYTPEELAERHKAREDELHRAKAMLEPVVERLQEGGFNVTSEAHHGHAGEVLCDVARKKNAAQIVVGRRGGSGLKDRLVGSVAFSLAQSAPVPVTIVP